VLVAEVRLQLCASPAGLGPLGCAREPCFHDVADFTEWTRQEQVAHAQDTTEAKQGSNSRKSNRFPKVWELMERVT
jgi:hypothetical protein